jgi:hypothetical protein
MDSEKGTLLFLHEMKKSTHSVAALVCYFKLSVYFLITSSQK